MVPKTTLKLLDLDAVTTREDVEEAVKNSLVYHGDIRVTITKPNRWGHVLTFAEKSERDANKLLETSRLKVGWVNSRIRQSTRVDRCYKCLGYGHQSKSCKGPDRSKLCYKCEAEGHKAATCTSENRCVLCADLKEENLLLDHVTGSSSCRVFREELSKARKIKI
ncbi:uncharacterized protein LOC117178709 [Belonocnema kinseyi]|uniref:uncharacterized protein LOC117178709 n=1 Tax=Belonocnema kinseyi TaxID=2817044 RepID=UPI00143CFFE4|nr:uncharacterized protein LOC117178709 [Belonocnema kinseyi]